MVQESCSAGKLPVDSKWSCIGLCACIMGHFLAVGGVVKCFGVYFVDLQEKYDASAADTAWIISITMCISMTAGIVGNGLFNWVGPRRATFVGAWLGCIGFALASIVPKIQFMYLTFSGITGIGCGILYAVSISAAGQYFHKYRGLAVGITQAGSGLGSFCLAPLARYFTNTYGVSGNMLLLGGLMLNMAVFSMFHTPKEFHEMQYRLKQNRLRRKACNAAISGKVNASYESETAFETNGCDVLENDNHRDYTTETQVIKTSTTFETNCSIVVEDNHRDDTTKTQAVETATTFETNCRNTVENNSRDDTTRTQAIETATTILEIHCSDVVENDNPRNNTTETQAIETETTFGTNCSIVVENNHRDDTTETQATNEHVSPNGQSKSVSCTDCLSHASKVNLREKLPHQAGESKLILSIESEDKSEVIDEKQQLHESDDLNKVINSPLTLVCPAMCPNGEQLNKQLSLNKVVRFSRNFQNNTYGMKNREYCVALSCKNVIEQQNNHTHFSEPAVQNDNSAINNNIKMSSYCNLSLLKNPLLLLYAGTFTLLLPPYTSLYVMLPPHATQLGFSDSSIAMLVSIIGITEVVFRIVNGFIIDRHLISNHILYKMSAAVMALGFCLIPSVRSYAVLAVINVVVVFTASLFVILMPIILREGIGEKHFPIAFGIAMFAMSPMFLAIPVIEGKLRDVTGRWDASFYTMGSLAMAASIVSLLHPWAAKRQRPE